MIIRNNLYVVQEKNKYRIYLQNTNWVADIRLPEDSYLENHSNLNDDVLDKITMILAVRWGQQVKKRQASKSKS